MKSGHQVVPEAKLELQYNDHVQKCKYETRLLMRITVNIED
jgi:hypothetical protein